MGTSRTDRAGDKPAPRWRRRAHGGDERAPASGHPQHVERLESELALLREENARLKVARERSHEPSLEERVRDLLPPAERAHADESDEPWELLTDCLMLRDGLIDACDALERGARETRRRLDALLAERDRETERAAAPDPAPHGDLESVA